MSPRNHTKSNGSTTSVTGNRSSLPPGRDKKAMHPVDPPLSNTRLDTLIYILSVLAVLYVSYFAYRSLQWKNEVGGWWNLALGKRPPQLHPDPHARGPKLGWRGQPKSRTTGSEPSDKSLHDDDESIEARINALAEALGMPSTDLAAAIAAAVREYTPPASISSAVAKAEETGGASEVVEALVSDPEADGETAAGEQNNGGIFNTVADGMGTVVGMDEPPEAM